MGAQTPTPALALSDGHHRQSASKARPRRATPKPMGRREWGIGPGRAEAGCGPQPPERSDQEGDQRNHRRPPGPGRCSPDHLPPFHRHTAFPYELVQREVRHLVAGPNDKTQRARPGHDIIVLPLLAPPPEVTQSVPPVLPKCARAGVGRGGRPTTPSGARAPHLHTGPGMSRSDSVRGSRYVARKAKRRGRTVRATEN